MKHLTGFLLVSLACASVFAASDLSMSSRLERPDSSVSNRNGKSFSLVANLFGISPSSSLEQGVSLSKFLSRDTLVQLDFGDGNTNLGGDILSNYKTVAHTSSTSLGVKHFVGNSFYVRGGVDYRHVNYYSRNVYSSTFFGTTTTSESVVEMNANSFSGSVVIGNQWQWENFTLGCDWFGVTAPFASTVNSERFASDSSDTSYERKKLEDRKQHYLK
ncbi:MAG: hypothetical protein EOP04_11245, partial [Proteobacteria bacterium]